LDEKTKIIAKGNSGGGEIRLSGKGGSLESKGTPNLGTKKSERKDPSRGTAGIKGDNEV